MATTPRTLQQLVEHAEDPDLIKAAQRAHVELSDRVEEQVARCTALEATAPTNRDLGTLTALYKGVATELAAGDEIAAAARASDADIAALHRSFKSIEERHSSFVPSVVDALREGNVPVSAAACSRTSSRRTSARRRCCGITCWPTLRCRRGVESLGPSICSMAW